MRIKTLCIIAALTWLIPIGGCNMDSPERIAATEQAVAVAQQKSEQVEMVVDQLEAFLTKSQAALADPNLPAEEIEKIAAAVVVAQEKLTVARGVKGKVDDVLTDWERVLANAGPVEGIGDEIELLGKGITTVGSHVPAPYGVYVGLAGSLITAAGGAYLAWKKSQAATALGKDLVNVIHSVDSLLDSPQITDEAAAIAVLKDRQGTTTANNVKTLKNG